MAGTVEAEVRTLITSLVSDPAKREDSTFEDVLAIPDDYGMSHPARLAAFAVELATGEAHALVRLARAIDELG
jgi:hypothetical protein